MLCLLGLLLLIFQGRPILFIDRRSGKGGEPFDCWKFRTMAQARSDDGELLPDHQRQTAIGNILRATSLDELPQLWNVLKGEMSLVGPRPLTVNYLDRYSPEQRRRLEVRPGITGWAQVNGRDSISWDRKFELDRWYVDHVSLWIDLRVMAATAVQLPPHTFRARPRSEGSGEFFGNETTQA